MNPSVLIIGHRGSSGAAPENTMAAFRQAAREGADMVELDVRLTRDGELVVFHDRRLGRTAPGWKRISSMTLAQLRVLDAGQWFGERFTGERIPTLREVLHHLPERLGINVEVKADGDRARRTLIVSRLVSLLRSERRQLLVTSFDHTLLRQFHQRLPSIPTGALYHAVRDLRVRPSTLVKRTGSSVFVCSITQLRKRFARDVAGQGITILVYGVTSERHVRRAVRLGANGIIADHPRRIRSLVTHL